MRDSVNSHDVPLLLPKPLRIVKTRGATYPPAAISTASRYVSGSDSSRKISTSSESSIGSIRSRSGFADPGPSLNVVKRRSLAGVFSRGSTTSPSEQPFRHRSSSSHYGSDPEHDSSGELELEFGSYDSSLSVRCSSSQHNNGSSRSSSLGSVIVARHIDRLGLDLGEEPSNPKAMSRGKLMIKRAFKKHKSDGRLLAHCSQGPGLGLGDARATSPIKSCNNLRGSAISNANMSKCSLSLDQLLQESIIEEGFHGREACVLVPQVIVTPEVQAIEDGEGPFDLWVAVEVKGKICRARRNSTEKGAMTYENASCHRSTYGYLHDLKIDVLPTANSSLVEVVGSPDLRILHLNSSILVVVHVCVFATASCQSSKMPQCDKLIADLESQLGSVQIEYLNVQVSYSHSSFPVLVGMQDGLSSLSTRVVTSATAIIERRNRSSSWSPPSARNPVFLDTITAHWGSVRTNHIVNRMATQRKGTPPMAPPPSSPAEQSTAEDTDDDDPARKIWIEMRRASKGTTGARTPGKLRRRNSFRLSQLGSLEGGGSNGDCLATPNGWGVVKTRENSLRNAMKRLSLGWS